MSTPTLDEVRRWRAALRPDRPLDVGVADVRDRQGRPDDAPEMHLLALDADRRLRERFPDSAGSWDGARATGAAPDAPEHP